MANKEDNVSETSETVLLIIDMISDFEFEDGDEIFPYALEAAKILAKLKTRLRKNGIPTVFVNDNFGKWHSDKDAVIKSARDSEKGGQIVELLNPDVKDYFVLKPRHSAFFSTALEVLLGYIGAKKLIITGITTDICILFTANDAYMREYELVVPSDCVAAVKPEQNQYALEYIERVLKTDVVPAKEIRR